MSRFGQIEDGIFIAPQPTGQELEEALSANRISISFLCFSKEPFHVRIQHQA